MMYYVNPKYISIDMIEFFSGNKYDNCESYKHVDSSVREKRKTKRDRQAESLKQFKNTFSYDFDQISSQSLPKTSIPKTLSTDSNNADLMESTSAQTVHQADELKASTGDFLLKDSEKPTLFQNVGNQLFHFVTKAAPIAVATIVASIVFEGKKTVEKS